MGKIDIGRAILYSPNETAIYDEIQYMRLPEIYKKLCKVIILIFTLWREK